MTNIAAMHGGGPKQELESLREHLRNQLERQKLPTDRSTHWVKSKSKWNPQTCTSPRRGERHALWIAAVGGSNRTIIILPAYCRAFMGSQWIIEPSRHEHSTSLTSGGWLMLIGPIDWALELTVLSESDLAAERARAGGPAARKRQAAARRDVICRQAEQFWGTHPALRGGLTATRLVKLKMSQC